MSSVYQQKAQNSCVCVCLRKIVQLTAHVPILKPKKRALIFNVRAFFLQLFSNIKCSNNHVHIPNVIILTMRAILTDSTSRIVYVNNNWMQRFLFSLSNNR